MYPQTLIYLIGLRWQLPAGSAPSPGARRFDAEAGVCQMTRSHTRLNKRPTRLVIRRKPSSAQQLTRVASVSSHKTLRTCLSSVANRCVTPSVSDHSWGVWPTTPSPEGCSQPLLAISLSPIHPHGQTSQRPAVAADWFPACSEDLTIRGAIVDIYSIAEKNGRQARQFVVSLPAVNQHPQQARSDSATTA